MGAMTAAGALTPLEEKALIRAAMKIIASRKTPARAAASKRNGKKGGRPRKKKLLDKPDSRV